MNRTAVGLTRQSILLNWFCFFQRDARVKPAYDESMIGAAGMRQVRNSIIAGFCGTLAHSLLMFVKTKTGLLPEFQPYDDLQRVLSWMLGTSVQPSVAWLLSFVNGAVIWGFMFGKTYRFLPGKSFAPKGIFFGICAWAVMGLLFFPLVDRGIFALRLGLGLAPATLMLVMLLAYSVTMSFVYHRLNARRSDFGPAATEK